jgi:hypothetical protein
MLGGRRWADHTFGSFLAFEKGTRCKSETASRRYRKNGYAPELTGIGSRADFILFPNIRCTKFSQSLQDNSPAPNMPDSNQWQCRG